VSEGPIPNSWKEAIPVVIWVVLVLAFGFLFADSVGQLFKDPLWRAVFALAAMVGFLAMLIYRKWLLARFQPLSGGSVLAAIIVVLLAIALSPYVEQQRLPQTASLEGVAALVFASTVFYATVAILRRYQSRKRMIMSIAIVLIIGALAASGALIYVQLRPNQKEVALQAAPESLPITAALPQRNIGLWSGMDLFGTLKTKGAQEFTEQSGSWHILLSNATPEESVVVGTLWRMLSNMSRQIQVVDHPNYDVEIDAPKFPSSQYSGLVFHGENTLSEILLSALGKCFTVRKSETFDDNIKKYYEKRGANNLVWIEVGPGSPWRTPESCRD